MAPRSVDDWPLVGRDTVVSAAWHALSSDDPFVVVLAGDAGIGKSRAAAEVAATASANGWTVRRITASQAAATIPFGALAPLLPEVVDSSDQLALLRSAQAAIVADDSSEPTLLWVDDAHQVDAGSAALLHQLSDAGSARILLTIRAGEPVPDPVESLWRGDDGVRIDLDPLDADTTGALLELALGPPVAQGTAYRLWQRSGGNPLMLREVVRATLYSGALSDESGAWLLADTAVESPALRDLVQQRLGQLADDEKQAVELLALSDVLSVELLLKAIPGLDVVGLEERGLIAVEEDGKRLGVRLTHPIYAEVTREGIPVLRRRRDHGRLIDVVSDAGARRREDVLRIAAWSLDADHQAPPETLAKAAEQALARLDLPLAARLAITAVNAGAGVPAQVTLASATWRQGGHDDALAVLEDATRTAETEDEIALVADTRAYVLEMAGRPAEAWRVLTEAGARVADDRRYLLDSQASILSTLAGRAIQTQTTVDGVRQRLASAGVTPSPLVRLRIDYAETFACALRGDHVNAERVAREGFDWINEDPDLPMPPELALLGRVLSRVWSGRIDDARIDAEAIEAAALKLGDRDAEWSAAMYLGRVDVARGRITDALGHFTQAWAIARDLDDRSGQRWTLAGQAMCRAMLGDPEPWASLGELTPSSDGLFEVDLVRRAMAWCDIAAGRFDRGREILREAAVLADDLGQDAVEMVLRYDLVRLGDRDQVDRLRALRERGDASPLCTAAVLHAEALAAQDGEQWLAASDALSELGAVVEAAECAVAAAECFRRDGASRQATYAQRRVASLLEHDPKVRTPGLATPADATPLTKRERDVAVLAVRQLSAAEIGEQLHLSRRTVENHLQRIYTKLGISSRSELADSLAEG